MFGPSAVGELGTAEPLFRMYSALQRVWSCGISDGSRRAPSMMDLNDELNVAFYHRSCSLARCTTTAKRAMSLPEGAKTYPYRPNSSDAKDVLCVQKGDIHLSAYSDGALRAS